MTEAHTTTLSVRGEARRDVDPDVARLDTRVRTVAATKADALQLVTAHSRSLLAALEALGGAVLTAADLRRPLGWTAQGATTWEESEWRNDQHVTTGRIGASVTIMIAVRDFTLIDAVSSVLDGHELTHLNGVSWSVDDDNPAWAQVRADAIGVALRKGRDYAEALGGTLVRVEHVADAGLLSGQESGGWVQQSARAVYKSAGEDNESPPLDPTPQRLSAVIDARFAATVAPL